MHRDSLDPRPASNLLEDVLENQWLIQRKLQISISGKTWADNKHQEDEGCT